MLVVLEICIISGAFVRRLCSHAYVVALILDVYTKSDPDLDDTSLKLKFIIIFISK